MRIKYLALTSLIIFLSVPAFCVVKLPQLLRDSMVLQRDAKVKIWGWASPNEKVTVDFLKRKYKAVADANGNWMVMLSKMQAGGPYTMEISGKNKINIARYFDWGCLVLRRSIQHGTSNEVTCSKLCGGNCGCKLYPDKAIQNSQRYQFSKSPK